MRRDENVMPRTSIHDRFDAVVDLVPSPGKVADSAYAIVKQTFAVEGGRVTLALPEPLAHDICPSSTGELPDSLPLGSDFWIHKRLTDVVVLGRAYAPGGRAVKRTDVVCEVGRRTKRIAVFGTRRIEWGRDSKPRIGAADSFTEMPVDNAHAYGGIDTRVPYPPLRSLLDVLACAADHPGAYPRNAAGKGYYVVPERFDGIELPNLENPDDLLTDDRLVLGAPQNWGRQPIPWTMDWQNHGSFPRHLFFGHSPRLRVPPGELTEVRCGLLEPTYETLMSSRPSADEHERIAREAFSDRFYQEAPLDMQHRPLSQGTPVRVQGMRPDGTTLTFELPAPPKLEVTLAGEVEHVEAVVTSLVVLPDKDGGRVMITYCGRTTARRQQLVPGIQTTIPLALRVDGELVRGERTRTGGL